MSYVRSTAICFAVLCLFAPAMHAGIVEFSAAGVTQDGSTLSGDIFIDTTAGSISSLSLTMSGPLSFTVNTFDNLGSGTALAIGAAQWIANGFFPMVLATVLAIVIITIRWYLGRRQRSATPAPAWSDPAAGPVRRPPRPPASLDTLADSGYPAGYRDAGAVRDPGAGRGGGGDSGWNDPASPGPPEAGSPGYRRPGPRPGSGPYNFSSGA